MLLIQPWLQTPVESLPAGVVEKLADPSGSTLGGQNSSAKLKVTKKQASNSRRKTKKEKKERKKEGSKINA